MVKEHPPRAEPGHQESLTPAEKDAPVQLQTLGMPNRGGGQPPRQQPPHRDPNPIPRPQQPPTGQHPPVVIHPGQPGRPGDGEHRMPHAPRPLPGGTIDPRHQDDGRWWRQDGGSMYVLIGHDYYRYGDGDGTPIQVLRQVGLTFDDASKSAVADLNGEREIVVSGDARSAVLYNLKDDAVDPVSLADNETGVILFNEGRTGADGTTRPTLSLVILTARNEVTGV
ncbi:MAG: hypothetical protein KGL74_09760 [Elusimicrobia bacterium]|nr:hypothetical protein [Elusimicrobiota bacterium]MDE2511396.1 hypothetical protein [Elusimicrobiota bacterium]